ncbi:MAG: hypothetical protein JSV92_03420 [archaeon]|nr:MAG: hypothetical protein JSV92_03420 [archaeon]
MPFNPGCLNSCNGNCSMFDNIVLPAIEYSNGSDIRFEAYYDELNKKYRCIIFKHGRITGHYEIVPNKAEQKCEHTIKHSFYEEKIEKAVLKNFEKEYCRGFLFNGCGLKKSKEMCSNVNKEMCEKSRFWIKIPVKV